MAQAAKTAAECQQQAAKTSSAIKVKPSYKHIPHSQKPPHLVAKRNARERRRVQAVNQAFYKLRKSVPIENRNKRVSKVKTLQRAIDYIRRLERILAEDDAQVAPVTLTTGRTGSRQQQAEQHEQQAPGTSQTRDRKTNSSASAARDKKPPTNCDERQPPTTGTQDANHRPQIIAGKQRRGRKPAALAAAAAAAPTHLAPELVTAPARADCVADPVTASHAYLDTSGGEQAAGKFQESGECCAGGNYGAVATSTPSYAPTNAATNCEALRESSAYNASLNYYAPGHAQHAYAPGYAPQPDPQHHQLAAYHAHHSPYFYNASPNQSQHPHSQQQHIGAGSANGAPTANYSAASAELGRPDACNSTFALLQSPSGSSTNSSLATNTDSSANSSTASAGSTGEHQFAGPRQQQVAYVSYAAAAYNGTGADTNNDTGANHNATAYAAHRPSLELGPQQQRKLATAAHRQQHQVAGQQQLLALNGHSANNSLLPQQQQQQHNHHHHNHQQPQQQLHQYHHNNHQQQPQQQHQFLANQLHSNANHLSASIASISITSASAAQQAPLSARARQPQLMHQPSTNHSAAAIQEYGAASM